MKYKNRLTCVNLTPSTAQILRNGQKKKFHKCEQVGFQLVELWLSFNSFNGHMRIYCWMPWCHTWCSHFLPPDLRGTGVSTSVLWKIQYGSKAAGQNPPRTAAQVFDLWCGVRYSFFCYCGRSKYLMKLYLILWQYCCCSSHSKKQFVFVVILRSHH